MGIDATITVTGILLINSESSRFTLNYSYDEETHRIDVYGSATDRFEFTLDRYFGVHYARGDWPNIYALIRATQNMWPRGTVHYGNDHDDTLGQECTPEFLATMWNYWTSKDAVYP